MDDSEKCNEFFAKILTKDRNPDYLKSLVQEGGISDETRDILLECIRDYQRKNSESKPGYVESILVSRFLKNTLKFLSQDVAKVEGPVSLFQMSHPDYVTNPQIFYLFGDIHVKINDCRGYKIDKWIKDTIMYSPVFIDVYIEIPYSYKKYPGISMRKLTSNNYLVDTYYSFEHCFLRKKSKDVCLTSRFHYTDMRMIFESVNQQIGYAMSMSDILITQEIMDYINSYINFLLDKNSFIHQRIQKQFDNITDPNIKRILEQSFQECQEKYQDYIKPISDSSIQSKASDVVNPKELLKYITCLMDYYLMGRCFRTYKRGVFKYHRPSYNNIIYAGEVHRKNYVDILLKLGFVIDFESINFDIKILEKVSPVDYVELMKSIPDFQCLDVSGMKQPMFHQRYRNDIS
uniref:Uncharacterized protein n=1 Tax=Marseillevirus LCMAC101 TaxID=2506602 RepID=A0A481YUG5_9VIRU|nr:MAG: hypothetical protein LCMAC101_07410 [Marseillevirus LCMAC101]